MADVRFGPSRHYGVAGIAALALAGFSTWIGFAWTPAFLPAGLFLISAALLFFFAFQPAVELNPNELKIGRRVISWQDVRRVDSTGWISPLLLYLTLRDGSRVLLIYPGDLKQTSELLHRLRRRARFALLDGVPYNQFWGESAPPSAKQVAPAPRYHVLRPEDEAEVEQMFQRLKSVGHLDPKNTTDEN